jgi:hypothetical protein
VFEFETGLTINEPGTLAVKATVEAAVVELIKEGEKKGVWDFKYPMPKEKAWYDFSKDKPVVEVKKEVTEVPPKKSESEVKIEVKK